MIKFFAKRYAKLSYIFSLEVEAGKSMLNSKLAAVNAKAKRAVVDQLNAEADAIDKSIEGEQAKLEAGYWECDNGHEISSECGCASPGHLAVVHIADCIFNGFNQEKCPRDKCDKPMKFMRLDQMSGQEKYELDREKKEAQAIAAEKRKLANEEMEKVTGGEGAAAHFWQNAMNSQMVADKIRAL